jgi:hypothetical protein
MERKRTFRNHGTRGHGIQADRRSRTIRPTRALAREVAKLDIAEEQALANEIYAGEVEAPEYR